MACVTVWTLRPQDRIVNTDPAAVFLDRPDALPVNSYGRFAQTIQRPSWVAETNVLRGVGRMWPGWLTAAAAARHAPRPDQQERGKIEGRKKKTG